MKKKKTPKEKKKIIRDQTRVRVQNRRRLLNEFAWRNDFESWYALETAAINGKLEAIRR